jgi:DNA-binding CsgD family transcriptional regulator
MAANRELPADVWKFIDSAEKHGAAVALYDKNDNIIFTNPNYRNIFKYADFSISQTYDSVFWKAAEAGLVDDPLFHNDPHTWLDEAHQFRRSHRFARYFIHHSTKKTYLAHHQHIDGVGTIAIRFDCTGKLISKDVNQDLDDFSFNSIAENFLETSIHNRPTLPSGVVSMTGKLIDANKEFLDILGRDDGISLTYGNICITSKSIDTRFKKAVEEICDTSSDSGTDFIKIPRVIGRGYYILSVSPMCASSFSTPSILRGVSLVSIVDLDAKPLINLQVLQNLFGLTAAEARVAASIGSGNDLSDTAKMYGISVGTVRNQLKKIFNKTGVNRQPDLVRLIYNISQVDRAMKR